MAEMVIIMAATLSVAMVIVVVVVVCIGCINLNKAQKKPDPDIPSQYMSTKPKYLFPEKLETLGAYFERFESDESRMFVTKISMLEINLKDETRESIDTFHHNEQYEGKDTRICLVDENEPKQNIRIRSTETEAKDVVKNEQGMNKTGYSDGRMQEIQEKTNIVKRATRSEDASDIDLREDIELSESVEDLDITASEESCCEDMCVTSRVNSSQLSEVNMRQNENINASNVSIDMNTTLDDIDDRSRECLPIHQTNDSCGKLQFLETILNSSVHLQDKERGTGRKKKSKRRRQESQFKQFQIGMFRYYLVRVKRRVKRSKQKNSSRVSPSKLCEQFAIPSSSASRRGISYPRPDSRMVESEADVSRTNHRSLVDIRTSMRQEEARHSTAFRKATNTQTSTRSRSRHSSSGYSRPVSCVY